MLIEEAESDETPEILKVVKKPQTAPVQPESIKINPVPAYCLKLKTTDGKKVFVNVCHNENVPAPRKKASQELEMMLRKIATDDDENTMMDYRVPMSIGEPHMETDNKGDLGKAKN